MIEDEEFKEWSNALLLDFKNDIFVPVLSVLTEAEIADAPNKVKEAFSTFRASSESLLPLNDEALELAEHYLERGIVTRKYREDALNIALATVFPLICW